MARPLLEDVNQFTVPLPNKIHENLVEVSKYLSLSKSALIKISTYSMLERYKKEGGFVFADLIDPSWVETTKNSVKVNVGCSSDLKKGLMNMHKETGLSMMHLGFLATNSFLKKFSSKKDEIFLDILKPLD